MKVERRVVVTGLGMLSPIGNDPVTSWANALDGKSGAGLIENFDTTDFAVKICAAVKDFDPTEIVDRKEVRRNDPFIIYGMAAGIQAIEDAGLEANPENPERYGIAIGSGIGGIGTIENTAVTLDHGGPRKVSPFFIPSSVVNMISGQLSIRYGFTGPNIAIVTACTSGTHNIGFGARMIKYGDADVMVAGGAEYARTPVAVAGFGMMKALSTRNDNPEEASRPWDTDRDGFLLGEGAGVLVLEEYERAKKRGAKIYAEVIGFGMSGDAFHITGPAEDGGGAILSMQNAMKDAGITVDDVDYINAHGTSTPLGDVAETIAIKKVFESGTKILVNSTKSMTGHLLGAAGSVEGIFTILAINKNISPPTINLHQPGDGCDLDYVPNTARDMKIEIGLSNSFGFGGTNGTLIFSAV